MTSAYATIVLSIIVHLSNVLNIYIKQYYNKISAWIEKHQNSLNIK